MAWDLIVKDKFSAAHYLENYNGRCENMHGHTFMVELHISGKVLDKAGISYDFTNIKKYLKKILPDHKLLNEVYDFVPSAENLSRHLYQVAKKDYPVTKVVVWESENAAACYSED